MEEKKYLKVTSSTIMGEKKDSGWRISSIEDCRNENTRYAKRMRVSKEKY